MTSWRNILILYTMKNKALFIHGLHSDSESTTGGIVADILKEYGFETIHPTFDLMNCNAALEQMKKIIKEQNISLVAAHSLGGFYGFVLPFDSTKILINPCLMPEKIIPGLLYPEQGEVFPENLNQEWPALREAAKNTDTENSRVFGIFAKNDPLFSYAEYAQKELNFSHIRMIEGEHKPTREQLSSAIDEVF